MILSAILSLDSAAFTGGLGKAIEGVKSMIRVTSDVAQRITEAFDMGGALSDLSAQTGEGVGDLMVLRQAFEDTGVGADSLGQTLAIMRKSLGGISETGEPTAKIFSQLGLDMEALKGMSAKDQLEKIGGAISSLSTPAEQSAAAMAVFGRGGNQMLTFLKDHAAISTAAASLGEFPALMQRNANAFDAVSDRIGRIKQKGKGLWAGIAEGLLPLANSATKWLDDFDLTKIGERIGRFFATIVEFFRRVDIGETLRLSLTIGMAKAANVIMNSFIDLGGAILDALITPLSYFGGAVDYVIQKAIEGISSIPGIDKIPGLGDLAGFKAQSFSSARAQNYDAIRSLIAAGQNESGRNPFAVPKSDSLAQAWEDARAALEENIKKIQDESNAGGATGTSELEATKNAAAKKSASSNDSERFARLGLFVGGGNHDFQQDTANSTKLIAGYASRILELMSTGPEKLGWA